MRRAVFFLLLCARPAVAAELGYEARLQSWALEKAAREPEPFPEGKRVEEVLVISETVVSPSDPWPELINVFHWLTRDEVVRREVLLREGDLYSSALVAETERNLRRLFIIAVARVLPVKGKQGGVALLVVTKDRLTLRLNSEFNFVGPLLQYLRLRPTEQNFLGRNQQVVLDAELRLDRVSLGQSYTEPRLFGSSLLFAETASLVLNRQTLALEGSQGKVVFARPLLSLRQPWGFTTSAEWRSYRRRVFRGASVWQLPYPDATAPTATVPFIFDVRALEAKALGTRSFGQAFKVNASAGVGGYTRRYFPPASLGLDAERSSWLTRTQLPRSEAAPYLAAELRAFEATYRVLRDVDTFQLSEDYQLGLFSLAQVRAAPRFCEAGVAVSYRLLAGGDLASVAAAATSRLGSGDNPYRSRFVNQRLALEVKNFSPPFEGGRFVTRALLDLRRHDLDNGRAFLGGGNGLRGAPPEALTGRSSFLFNAEYRTRPFELRTLFIGLVLFYDAGSAFDEAISLTHTTGLGVRVLVPQWNQETIRLDLGFVVNGSDRLSPDRLSGSFGQVTDYRPEFFSDPLP